MMWVIIVIIILVLLMILVFKMTKKYQITWYWCQNIRENMVEKRVNKFGQGPPPPLFGQCPKEIDIRWNDQWWIDTYGDANSFRIARPTCAFIFCCLWTFLPLLLRLISFPSIPSPSYQLTKKPLHFLLHRLLDVSLLSIRLVLQQTGQQPHDRSCQLPCHNIHLCVCHIARQNRFGACCGSLGNRCSIGHCNYF